LAHASATSLEHDLVFAAAEGIAGNFERWLGFVGARDGEWVELQALGVPGTYAERVQFAHADTSGKAVRLLEQMEARGATGVYTIANRINPAAATRATPGRWHDAKKGNSTSDRDITHRRVVFIDVDVQRPSGTSATTAELGRTIPVAAAIHARLGEIFGEDALGYAHSGNGRQVFLALEETPESSDVLAIVRGFLAALAAVFATADTTVDISVCDAKRLVPAFGTTKRKGAPGIADRPHRITAFVCAQSITRVSAAALERSLRLLAAAAPAPAVGGTAAHETARPALPQKAASPPQSAFTEANAVAVEDVVEALGLKDGSAVACPGCKNTSGVSLVGNGLKCHHQSCATRGVPGHAGFRTVVDIVAEAQALEPSDAADWVLARFGTPSRQTEGAGLEEDIESDVTEEDEKGAPLEGPPPFAGRRFPLTDVGNAERFVAHHGLDIAHCHEWKKWLAWDEGRWAVDRRGEVDFRAVQTVRAINAEAKHPEEESP
jgi:hypothetical protein